MATKSIIKHARPRIIGQATTHKAPIFSHPQSIYQYCNPRLFSSSTKFCRQQAGYKESFGTRLRKALNDTKIKWYPIPVGVGIGFLGLGQLYRVNEREKTQRRAEWDNDGLVKSVGTDSNNGDGKLERKPKRRERIKPTGPWFVLV